MLTKQLSDSQQAFIESVTDQVNQAYSSQLNGTFQMVNYPAGFHPAVQYGASAYYNSTMLDVFNGTLEIGSNGMLTLGNAQFSTLFYNILRNATYQYSTADQKVVQDPNLENQQIAVVNTATSSGFVAAYSVSPVTYQSVMKAVLDNFAPKKNDWSTANISAAAGSLPNAGFASLGQAIAAAVQLLSPLNTILGAQSSANAELAAAMNNAQNPSAASGGLPINATDFYVGWTPLPTNNQIQGGLDSASKLSIHITASNFTSHDASFSISGKAGFTVPVFDVFDIGFSGGSSYDWTKHSSASSSLDVTIDYTGVTIVQIDPMPLSADHTKGWYDQTLLQSIIQGSGNPDVSGFKIDPSNQYAPARMFGQGKAFSRLKSIVVSKAPTITMVFSADQANAVTSQFSENSSVNVKLFGIFNVGSVDQSYSVSDVKTDSASGKVTVVMAPPAIQGTVPIEKQVATVIGGVADYPPPAQG